MELTEQQARDIDEILAFAVERGFPNGFDVSYYQRAVLPELEKSYLYYLTGLANHYMNKYGRKWINIDYGKSFTCNNHTKAFLENGGFKKIYEDERKQELKNEIELKLAEKTLKGYPLTRFFAWAGFFIALIVAGFELYKFIKGK